MKKALSKLKIILIFLIVNLVGCDSVKNKSIQNEKNLIIGTWIIEKSTYNGQGSPVTKGTNLKFTTDNQVTYTLSKFGQNFEDISAIGLWELNNGIVTIDYGNEELYGEKQVWRIIKLTDKILKWEMEMQSGIQEEIYNRKK
ncbi:lipocalin-like domain-containing protein [Ulvibacter antarcticus]|uniref:Lipocalin-like protein n=1 Tax=Ulvibacter antarcticus TaxID=442714 RepID=A0A3L9Y7D4_9FLAO|nr:lipocalin family protein [Ulvibacter antarcticus]RMA56294.1 lipocalin-like protein [Ulvibacter antarcticus]